MQKGDLLLAKYFSGEASENEKQLAKHWIKDHPKEAEKLKEAWQLDQTLRFAPDVNRAWKNVSQRINTKTTTRILGSTMFGWVAAAMLVVGIGFAWWQIEGKAQGKWVIQEAKIKQNSPILLADGTKIWLNRDSRLRYPKRFDGTKRTVYLEGEAFFEVARKPEQPFIIYSGKMATEVLGTSFNLRANKQDTVTEVTVRSGKVAFFNADKPGEKLLLTKGQQGTYIKHKQQLIKHESNNTNLFAWKTGVFIFKETKLNKVIGALATYYNKPVRLANTKLGACVLTTTLDQLSLEEVAETIALTLNINYHVSNNEVVLSGTACNQ